MNVRGRRGLRGAFRETPEEILERAIAAHKALRDREQWEAARRTCAAAAAAKRKTSGAEAKRAQFAEAVARSEFGRFYYKAPAKGKARKNGKGRS